MILAAVCVGILLLCLAGGVYTNTMRMEQPLRLLKGMGE